MPNASLGSVRSANAGQTPRSGSHLALPESGDEHVVRGAKDQRTSCDLQAVVLDV